MGDYVSKELLLDLLANLYATATEEQEEIILKIANGISLMPRFIEKVNE